MEGENYVFEKNIFENNPHFSVHRLESPERYLDKNGYNYNYLNRKSNLQKVSNTIKKLEVPETKQEVSVEMAKSVLPKIHAAYITKTVRISKKLPKMKSRFREHVDNIFKLSKLLKPNIVQQSLKESLKSTVLELKCFSRNDRIDIKPTQTEEKAVNLAHRMRFYSSSKGESLEKVVAFERSKLAEAVRKMNTAELNLILDSPKRKIVRTIANTRKMGQRYDPLNFDTSNQINRVKRNYYGALYHH